MLETVQTALRRIHLFYSRPYPHEHALSGGEVEGGVLAISRFHFGVSMKLAGPGVAWLGAQSVGGRLHLTLMQLDPFVSPELSECFRGQFLRCLGLREDEADVSTLLEG